MSIPIASVIVRLLIAAAVIAVLPVTAAWPVSGGGKKVIQNFDLKNVTLEGNLRRQFEEVKAYYLAIPNDDLLKPYKMRAGLPAPGQDLGGLYVGHSPLPQMISGLTRMYAATGDTRCRDKAIVLADGWAECFRKDKQFFAAAGADLPHYYYDKWVGALVDLIVYAKHPKAKGYLATFTDWAEHNLSRKRPYAQPQTTDGGEWYTLTENLLRAYTATGDKRYRDFAKVWEYTDFWTLLADGKNIFENMPKPSDYTPWYHAYSHVNSLDGLGMTYLVTGDKWYRDTLVKAWEFLMKEHIMVTGGYGQSECLVPVDQQADKLGSDHNSFETQCGSWAGFKVSEYLTTITGEARYGDWVELLVINGIGASIPSSSTGGVFYYADYPSPGGAKNLIPFGWPCCSGTRSQAIPEYHDLIYYKDNDGLYISLYAASSVRWTKNGKPITVRQITNFPESDKVDIIVEPTPSPLAGEGWGEGKTIPPIRFALKLRIPNWLAAPIKAAVNGKAVPVKKDPKGWAVFDRKWSPGDKLTVTLPMGFRVHRPDPSRDYPAAVAYGPVTLAMRYKKGNPAKLLDFAKVAEQLESVPGETLTWRVKSHPDALVRPFYRYKENEPYFLYLDPRLDMPAIFSFSDVNLIGEWLLRSDHATSPNPGASAEFTFFGDNLRVRGFRYDDCGKLSVTIDGNPAGVIDQYGPNRNEAATWDFTGFGPGQHKARLEHIGGKAPESKGEWVNIAGFDCGW